MGVIELLLLSIGLAMDAFAVSVCKGISMKKINCKKSCIIGLWFGGFQALMPTIGYFLGSAFESLGGNMIKEAFCKEKEDEESNDDISFKTMFVLAVATSIDALAIGITFAFLKVNLLLAISMIGIITFVISIIGTKVGNKFGSKYEKKAELAGEILLEHLGIL